MSLTISSALLKFILTHAEEDYPHECCGALMGARLGGDRIVISLSPLANVELESPNRRFVIDPTQLLLLDKQARSRGEDVIGFYHSHPDSPAIPSLIDLEWAWPEYSYVIVSASQSAVSDAMSYQLLDLDDEKQFVSEPMIVTAD